MAKAKDRPSALAAFNALQLDEIDADIAQVDEEIAGLQKRRDSLTAIRKAVFIRDNGRPPRKNAKGAKRATAADSSAEPEHDQGDDSPSGTAADAGPTPQAVSLKLYHELRRSGPATADELAREVNLPVAMTVKMLDRSERFRRRSDDKYELRAG